MRIIDGVQAVDDSATMAPKRIVYESCGPCTCAAVGFAAGVRFTGGFLGAVSAIDSRAGFVVLCWGDVRSAASTALSKRDQPSGSDSTGGLVGMRRPRSQIYDAMDAPYEEYWAALGRFVHEFSRAEQALLALLRQISGLTEPIGGIILTNSRVDQAKEMVKRIFEVDEQSMGRTRMERPFAQLAVINTMRNHIIHWGAVHDGADELLVSNAHLHPHPDRAKEFRVSPDDLAAMSIDLYHIAVYFLVEASLQQQLSRGSLDTYTGLQAEPWLYKPPRPTPRKRARNPGNNEDRPRQKRPPKSSPP
jgi:hypothetical protein